MGVQSLVSFQLHMRMNGQYFGKYAYTEQMDTDSLKVRQACVSWLAGSVSSRQAAPRGLGRAPWRSPG